MPEDNYRNFEEAAKALINAQKVAILTGFACILNHTPHYETDGISGSLSLMRVLLNMGKEVSMLLDKHSKPYMKEIVMEYIEKTKT